ncbi:MAG: YesL family protein [Clostridia bacterium]|nr:YesL family protein [Clostridia bacterium]
MKRIFGLGSPLVETLSTIGDIICVSALWIIFSLPIVTMGASGTALYTTVYRCIRLNKAGIWKNFWNSFKDNFKVSTLAWLVELLVIAVLTLDAMVFRSLWKAGESMGSLYWVALVFWFAALTWQVYVAAYTARFTGRVREVLYFGIHLLRMHPLYALGMMLLLMGALALCLMSPVLVIFAPGAVCWVSTFLLERVFRLHMRPEDLERETGGLQKNEDRRSAQ